MATSLVTPTSERVELEQQKWQQPYVEPGDVVFVLGRDVNKLPQCGLVHAVGQYSIQCIVGQSLITCRHRSCPTVKDNDFKNGNRLWEHTPRTKRITELEAKVEEILRVVAVVCDRVNALAQTGGLNRIDFRKESAPVVHSDEETIRAQEQRALAAKAQEIINLAIEEGADITKQAEIKALREKIKVLCEGLHHKTIDKLITQTNDIEVRAAKAQKDVRDAATGIEVPPAN